MRSTIRFMVIPIIVTLFLMVFVQAASIYFPLPINGKVIQANPGNIEIQITNERTGITMMTVTNSKGEYLIDWANSDNKVTKYQTNDIFKINVVGCEESLCEAKYAYQSQPEIYHVFNLAGINVIPTEPEPIPSDWEDVHIGGNTMPEKTTGDIKW